MIVSIQQIPKIFKVAALPDIDLVQKIVKPAADESTEPNVILEGSLSKIKLSFVTNRKSFSMPCGHAIVNPRARRGIESGVQYYSNSMSDGSGFKKKIHGGDGRDENVAGGGYDKGCAAFLEFHEVSQACTLETVTSLKCRDIRSAVPLIPVPRHFAVGLRYVADIGGNIQQLP